ncbi:MAG TPA: hypothetical protein VJY54_13170 [Lachnospiraceae bacterium]|nr:hypothetical protein [Lachnospiraceae bacterium]
MEEMTVVYFVLDHAAAGRKKRRGDWIYHTEQKGVNCGGFKMIVVIVYLPVYCRKRKEWEKEEWLSYSNGLPIPEESSRIRYFWQDGVGDFLGRTLEPLSFEWISLLLSYYQVTFTELVILDDRDMPTEEIIRHFVSQTRKILVVTNDSERYEEFGEELYEEYGFLLCSVKDAKELHLKENLMKESHIGNDETLLVIAGKSLYHMTPAMIPENTIWFSTEVESSYEKKIGMRAKNSKVIGMQSFWKDMSRKNEL